MSDTQGTTGKNTNRREFIKAGTLAAAGTLAGFNIVRNAWGQNADELKVGVIGCGGRGTGAAENCLRSAPNMKLIALADLYEDHLNSCRRNLEDPDREGGRLEGVELTDDMCFVGFDAFKKLLATDVDLVILATPPGFRPEHFEATVAAGKHIFCEKPVAVDPDGIRRFMKAGELSVGKGLAVVAGTQRRHDPAYQETIRRIHDGEIGDVISARAFWNGGWLWKHPRQPGWTDVEYQTRNWYYFDWICGDHIVEQHVHNLDVINWVMGAHPVKALGAGGRQQRTDEVYGNIWDHFVIDYEYPGGQHMLSMCRHWQQTDRLIGEFIAGSTGRCENVSNRHYFTGANRWRYRGEEVNPYVQEHTDLVKSIREGSPINESQNVAEATMTAILGRTAAYTGMEVSWDDLLASDMDLAPDVQDFGPMPVHPVPMPGEQG